MTTSTASWRGLRWIAMAAALALMVLAIAGLRSELATAGPQATASRTESVDIAHFAFHPPTLTIAKGTTVNFVNSSRVTHTATDAGAFNTGRIRPGLSISIRFNHAGTFSYHCLIHPRMHGKIVVK